MKDIVLQKSTITEIAMKPSAGNRIVSKIKVVSIMTAEIAAVLGAKWLLFDKEQIAKAGYTAVELDFELVNVRMKFASAKLDKNLDMYIEKAGQFKVYRKGAKAKPKRLMVSFRLHYSGSPFELLEYLLRVGGIEGTCTLMPRQGELPLESAAQNAASNEGGKAAVDTYSDKSWFGEVKVSEVPDGYAMTRRATSPTAKLKQVPATVFASEQAAREEGLSVIRDWADKIIAKSKGYEKKEAQKLSDWCSEKLPDQVTISEVIIKEGDGNTVYEGTGVDLKNAAAALRKVADPKTGKAAGYPD